MSLSKIQKGTQKGTFPSEQPNNAASPRGGGETSPPRELLATLREKRDLLTRLESGHQHAALVQKLDQTIADLEAILSALEQK